ncbi:MAG: hypothetical protein GC149_01870 [Gammaproteobacteria bacterium]|nr:hypothetical protein [Gammaproteobacteria bacterium]
MDPYRPLRYVADYHAMAGIPALRFDYHGTGDSSGLNDEADRLADWLRSIKLACQQLRDMSGCKKIIVFGFRFGGALATLVAQDLAIDGLILWAPVESGRQYLREIRALQMAALNQPDASGLLEAGGAVFVPATIAEIDKIKLCLCRPKANRILIIPRDDLPASDKLKLAWGQQGLAVDQVVYPGFANMMLEARFVQIPHAAIQKIVEWSCELAEARNVSRSFDLPFAAVVMTLPHFNSCADERPDTAGMIQESIIKYGPDNSRLGILSGPATPAKNTLPIVILANSGSNHRVGPNRLYVLFARALARKGYRCLRIDMDGLGDGAKADPESENIVYMDHSSDEIHLAIKSFGEHYKENKYILTGLCSGAYFAFRACLDLTDIDIVECHMINPLTFHWEAGMTIDDSPAVTYVNWYAYKKSIKNPASWLKLLTGRVSIKNLLTTIWNRLMILTTARIRALQNYKDKTPAKYEGKDLDKNLYCLAERNIHISFLLARDDAGYDVLMSMAGKTARKLQKRSKLSIQFIEKADHTFSRYTPRCQAINKLVEHFENKWGSNT